jgi:hypothetical protein
MLFVAVLLLALTFMVAPVQGWGIRGYAESIFGS